MGHHPLFLIERVLETLEEEQARHSRLLSRFAELSRERPEVSPSELFDIAREEGRRIGKGLPLMPDAPRVQ